MKHEKWFISDTHFFHANMLKFTNADGSRVRPFNSLDEQHEIMVDRWNKLVKDNDYVYHLGDVTFQYHKPFNELMHRLKGHKRLIVGNHDKIWNRALQMTFEKVDLWKGFKEGNFTAVHIPLELKRLRDGAFCVHGHTHATKEADPHYINVCVETRDYAPVHMDTILEEIRKVGR